MSLKNWGKKGGKKKRSGSNRGEEKMVNSLGPGKHISLQNAKITYISRKIFQGPAVAESCSAAGLINVALATTIANFTNNANLFATFDEWKVHEWGVQVQACQCESSAAIAGITNFWFDEDDTTVPTFAMTSHRTTQKLQNSAVASLASCAKYTYKPNGLVEKDWVNTTGSPMAGSFKIYTDAANFGTQASAQVMYICTPFVIASFRGLN